MKTLKFFIVMCIIIAFSTNNANSQKDIQHQNVCWIFTPEPLNYDHVIYNPCLPEVMTGCVDEILSYTKKTLHVYPQQCVLTGADGEKYTLDYEWNSFKQGEDGSWKWNLPMILRHDGKLVAVLHFSNQAVFNGQGELVVTTSINKVDCK